MVSRSDGSPVTATQWGAARSRARRVTIASGVVGIILVAVLALPALYLAVHTSSGSARYPAMAAWLALVIAPLVVALVLRSVKEQEQSDGVVAMMAEQLTESLRTADRVAARQEAQASRQEFESRLANALDMAEGEPEVIDVIERSLTSTLPDSPVELLLADNSHAHLLRMATASPTGVAPGCGVDSPDHCPAARRAQVQRFPDSEALDACPKLRGRLEGAMSRAVRAGVDHGPHRRGHPRHRLA